MKNGKFTSLALLSVFTVGFAQSSVVGAIVDSGSIVTATKVSSGGNDKSGNTVKGNDNVETKGPSCTPPENGGKTVFIGKDKNPQSSGGVSARQGMGIAASAFGIPGAVWGAKKVAELVKKGRNKNLPSETPENSGHQQSTSGSGTTSGQQVNNAGNPTVPAYANIGSPKGNSNLGLYLLVGGIIILVIVVVVVIFCLLKCRNRNKKTNISFQKEITGGHQGNEISGTKTIDGKKSPDEDEKIKLSEKKEEIKKKLEVTGDELDELFNSEYFDLNAAICLCSIVTHWQFGDNAVKGIKLLLGSKDYLVFGAFSTALAYLLNNEDVGGAREGILRFFTYYGSSSRETKVRNAFLFAKCGLEENKEALKGLKAFLYYVGTDDERKQFLGQFFDAVSLCLDQNKDVDSFLNFLSKVSLLDSGKMATTVKNFFDVIKDLPRAKKVFSKFSEENFSFDGFVSDLSAGEFSPYEFSAKWGVVGQVQH